MSLKTATMGGVLIGGLLGSFVPLLWGGSPVDFSSVIFSAIGGIAGIYIGYKIAD